MRRNLARVLVSAVMGASAVAVGVVSSAPTPVAAAPGCDASTPTATSPEAPESSGFHPVDPVRLLDTRTSGGAVNGGCTAVVDLSSDGRAPADATSLALNVTAVDAIDRGFVTVYPCGSPRPAASSVNARTGDTTANAVLTALDGTRKICIYVQVTMQLVVDMTGWFGDFGASYHGIPGTRLIDTRTIPGPDGTTPQVPLGTELPLHIAGTNGVPAEATAVSVNVTVTSTLGNGFATAYPCGTTRPPTSTVNYRTGETRANHALVGLGDGGALCIYNSQALHVVVDIEGWFGGEPDSGLRYRPLGNTRVLDTRNGTGGVTGKIAQGTTASFDPAGSVGLPLGAVVVLNIVATETVADGYLTVFPCGTAQPTTSAVNAVVGTEATNSALVTSNGGTVCVFVSQAMHVVVDVVGTFGPFGPLQELTVGPRPLVQRFSPDAHDYTVECATGTNSLAVHAVGAPGTVVSIAPSTAPAPPTTSRTADLTVGLQENQAFVVRAGAPGSAAVEYWVRCLPHDFPPIRTQQLETPSAGWYLTDAAFPNTGPGDPSRYVMILDSRSVPVWYHEVAEPSIDLTRMPDGTVGWTRILGQAFGATPGAGYEVHALDGTLLRTITTVSGPTDHHGIATLPNGNVVLATYVARHDVDLRALGAGYGEHELVYDSHLEEIAPDGSVVWTWRSEEHIPVSATTFPVRLQGIDGVGVDLVHINSISIAPDGDVLVSARHTDAVYKIRREEAGDVVLRIGGTQSDLRFVDDPLNGFARQHDAQLLPSGNLLLFDNRTNAGVPRAVEYDLDLRSRTARLVWSVTDPRVTASGGVGSVRGLGDGDRVITWGGSVNPNMTEVDAKGRLLQTTFIGGHYAFRTEKQPLAAFDIAQLRLTAGS